MSSQPTVDTSALLSETYATIRLLSDTTGQLEQDAAEARLVARLLERELASIRSTFDPIRTLHSPHTWTGLASQRSRRRLDQHEDEHQAAIHRIDQTIDDLLERAMTTESVLRSTNADLDTARRKAAVLEVELGRYDDVII